MNIFLRRIRRYQAKNNSRERNCASHVSSLGFLDIGVLRGRHTTLKYSIKMIRMIWRNNHNLHPKNKGMKQQKKSILLLRKEKLQYFQVCLDFTPLDSRVIYKAKRLKF